MPFEVFIDESERREYLLAAVVVDPRELKAARGVLRAMLLGGERRLHFSKERDTRRRELLSRFCEHGFRIHIYVTSTADHHARRRLLVKVAEDLSPGLLRLVIESRGYRDRDDLGLLIDLQRSGVLSQHAAYEHVAPHEEPILWVADGVAWAWGAGGDWKRRVAPLVTRVQRIDP